MCYVVTVLTKNCIVIVSIKHKEMACLFTNLTTCEKDGLHDIHILLNSIFSKFA